MEDFVEEMLVRFFINSGDMNSSEIQTACQHMEWWLLDVAKLSSSKTNEISQEVLKRLNISKTKSQQHVVAGVVFNKDRDSVLFVKNCDNAWTFPKGKVESGENQVTGICREVLEETGVDISTTKMQLRLFKEHGLDKMNLYYTTLTEDVPAENLCCSHRNEIQAIEWWKISDIAQNNKDKQPKKTGKWFNEDGNKLVTSQIPIIEVYARTGELPA